MVKDIVKDEEVLTKKSEDFIFGEDDYIIQDLIDTATAHKDNCVGLAAVQIGYHKRVFVALINGKFVPFINPRIISKFGKPYIAEEGCLSVDGVRSVKRYKQIYIKYLTKTGNTMVGKETNYTAEIIQHEYDHLEGILI